MCLHSTQEQARPSPCFGFHQLSSCSWWGFESSHGEAAPSCEPLSNRRGSWTEENAEKTPKTPQSPVSSASAPDLVPWEGVQQWMTRWGQVWALWGQQGQPAEGPGGCVSTWDHSCREPLGSHYPGGAQGDTGGQHEEGPALARAWSSLTKLPDPRELFLSCREAAQEGRSGPRVPFPPCPPDSSSSWAPGNELCTHPGLGIWHKLPTLGTGAS